jgi:hypothetical protein
VGKRRTERKGIEKDRDILGALVIRKSINRKKVTYLGNEISNVKH